MTAGAYKYCESIDFEILMIAYAFNDEPIRMIDLALGDKIPQDFLDALVDPTVEKHAHNANFERNSFRAIGYDVPIEQWHCSAVKSAYCGLPLSLAIILGLYSESKNTSFLLLDLAIFSDGAPIVSMIHMNCIFSFSPANRG